MENDKRFDLVVWGATGFTGRLVAEYLAGGGAPDGVRWAMAGRSREKLETVRQEVAALHPSAAEVELIVADSHDRASLDALVADTRVIISTVGPFAQYGSELVAACVAAGVDYCDITGEVPWIREMIDRHHAEAQESGARIVNCCGFDSIPSDLGCLLVQEHALAATGAPCSSVAYYLRRMKGEFSGGTIASMLGTVEAAADRKVRRLLRDPYALNPEGSPRGKDGPDQMGVAHDPDLDCWTGPFVMAGINTRVVRRSNALLDQRYGADFAYREVSAFAGGGGWFKAVSATAGMGALMSGLIFPPTRALMQRFVLPAPGEGPNREQRDAGHFSATLLGLGPGDRRIEATVAADGDPGYKATAMMLGEAALCLALDEIPGQGGVFTPASAMGMTLVERLRRAGMTFEII